MPCVSPKERIKEAKDNRVSVTLFASSGFLARNSPFGAHWSFLGHAFLKRKGERVDWEGGNVYGQTIRSSWLLLADPKHQH